MISPPSVRPYSAGSNATDTAGCVHETSGIAGHRIYSRATDTSDSSYVCAVVDTAYRKCISCLALDPDGVVVGHQHAPGVAVRVDAEDVAFLDTTQPETFSGSLEFVHVHRQWTLLGVQRDMRQWLLEVDDLRIVDAVAGGGH